MIPADADLLAAITATWPPEETRHQGPFTLCRSQGGGNRVRAARLAGPDASVGQGEIATAAGWMQAQDQPVRFMVLDSQPRLDAALAGAGYVVRDPTLILGGLSADLAVAPPPVTVFEVWPPLAIQTEIWTEGGIGADRRAIMARAPEPKVSLFGRINDRPAAAAFVAVSGDIAMLHALEVSPEARRHGLARHMVGAAADWALRNAAPLLCVLVTRANTAARGLYASVGMQQWGGYHYRAPDGQGRTDQC